ncbi:MAG: hypothetical protein WCL32_22085, partial [Planctomycetota bacterium]
SNGRSETPSGRPKKASRLMKQVSRKIWKICSPEPEVIFNLASMEGCEPFMDFHTQTPKAGTSLLRTVGLP